MFHITLVLLLSAIIAVEAIGFYITKDICDPCGSSTLVVDILKPVEIEQHTHTHDCCASEKDHTDCCHNTSCEHNDKNHQHHQENYYLSNTPDFFEKQIKPNLTPQLLAVLLPDFFFRTTHNETSDIYYHTDAPLTDSLDSYRAFLCTYLI